MKMWRDIVRSVFCGATGIYPLPLGPPIVPVPPRELLLKYQTFAATTSGYPERYKKLLGSSTIEENQAPKIISVLLDGKISSASNGSVKNSLGSHAYGYSSGTQEGEI